MLDLGSISLIVGIVVGLATAIPIIVGWVIVPIRRRWKSTKEAFDTKVAEMKAEHEEKIKSLTEDHARDLAYMERRLRDVESDLKTCREERRFYEERWHNPPGFQV